MARVSLRLRRTDQSAPLRPIDQASPLVSQYDSALRSDYQYVDAPLGIDETWLNVDNIGYDAADLRFTFFAAADSPVRNPFPSYGLPDAYDVVRSLAGVPVTNLDGTQVARYDFTAYKVIATAALTGNVVTMTTTAPHQFTTGQSVIINLAAVAESFYNGTYTIIATPTPTTFTYAKVHADALSAAPALGGTATVYGVGATPFPVDQKVRIVDHGLPPGRFVYYALFARYNSAGNVYWFRVAQSEMLVPIDYRYTDRLWRMIPEYYRTLDEGSDGVLRRFIGVLGYEADMQRSWNSTLGDLWDAETVNSRMLPNIAYLLGHGGGEEAIGDKRSRILLANLMYLRKFRGTKDGIEGWVAAISGYKVLTYVGKNLMLSNNDAELRTSVGGWTSVSGGTVARIASAGEVGGPSNVEFYLRLTATSSTTTTLTNVNRIPVTAGHQYRISYMVKSSVAARTTSTTVTWYDIAGAAVGAPVTDTPISAGAVNTWTAVAGNWLTAPANATAAQITLNGPAMVNADTIAYFKVMFTDRSWLPIGQPALYGDPSSAYESPRTVHISLYPARTNYAINSDFRAVSPTFPASGWAITDPATYSTLPFAYATYAAIYTVNVSFKAQATTTATLTTASPHTLVPGSVVTVAGVGAPFDGTFTLTAATSNTISYTVGTSATVTTTAATGTVVPAPESSYDDLAAGFDSLSTATTATFNGGGLGTVYNVPGYMTLSTSTGPFSMRASSSFFPVVRATPFSARVYVICQSGLAAATAQLRFKWFTAANAGAEIPPPSSNPDKWLGSATAVPNTWVPGTSLANSVPVVAGNMTPPAGALWGRVVIEVNSTAACNANVTYAVIEDAPLPGPYFDGWSTDGAFGDFRFTGTPGASFSAYYPNFNAVLNTLGTPTVFTDRLHAVLPAIIPIERDVQIHSVLNSLL